MVRKALLFSVLLGAVSAGAQAACQTVFGVGHCVICTTRVCCFPALGICTEDEIECTSTCQGGFIQVRLSPSVPSLPVVTPKGTLELATLGFSPVETLSCTATAASGALLQAPQCTQESKPATQNLPIRGSSS